MKEFYLHITKAETDRRHRMSILESTLTDAILTWTRKNNGTTISEVCYVLVSIAQRFLQHKLKEEGGDPTE
jgi:hypothetical protein